MMKYYLLFLCYLISIINAGNNNAGCGSLKFDIRKGWIRNCLNTTDGKVDVTYNCTDDGKDNRTSLDWLFGGLPINTQSVTIQNCKLNLNIGPTGNERKVQEMIKNMTKIRYEHFSKLAFKNIKDLTIGPLLSGLQLIMNGNLSLSVENVDNMRIMPSALISSDPKAYKYNNKNMGRFNFTMSYVNIEEVESEAIDWKINDVPIELIWQNVNVKRIEEGAIKMHGYDVQYPLGKINTYPESNVYITNCTFNRLPTNVVIGLTKNFIFFNNRVDEIEPSAINITSQNINLSKNEFNYVHELAFSSLSKGTNASLTFNSNIINASDSNSIYFGAHDSMDANENTTSIHENKFKCINSSWLLEKRNETKSITINNQNVNSYFVSKYEKILFRNTDNVCFDEEFKNLSVSVQQFYRQFPVYGDNWEKYTIKPGSPISLYTCSLVIIVTLVIITIMGLYLYMRKK